jgi:hypothetical protein
MARGRYRNPRRSPSLHQPLEDTTPLNGCSTGMGSRFGRMSSAPFCPALLKPNVERALLKCYNLRMAQTAKNSTHANQLSLRLCEMFAGDTRSQHGGMHGVGDRQHKQKHFLHHRESDRAQRVFSSFKTAEGRLAFDHGTEQRPELWAFDRVVDQRTSGSP